MFVFGKAKVRVGFLLFFFLILFQLLSISALGQGNSKEQLESAFIFHFGQNIKWKNESNFTEFRIHYLGNNERIIQGLTLLSEEKKIKNKPILFTKGYEPKSIPSCQLLFIDQEYNNQLKSILKQVEGTNTLVVSEHYSNKNNLMINFITKEDEKLSFEINKYNVEKENLEVAPDLMIYGGSEIDKAEVYRQSKESLDRALDSLENERSKVKLYKQEINELKENISSARKRLEEQRRRIEESNEVIEKQRNQIRKETAELEELEQRTREMQEDLKEKQDFIRVEELKIASLKKDIKERYQDIEENDARIAKQNQMIRKQKVQIEASGELLEQQDIIIEKQRWFVTGAVIIIVIILALTFLLVRASRAKEKAFNKLKLQNIEIMEQRSKLIAQAEELSATNEQINAQKKEIEEALEQLKQTQTQLILSEKMATLGQTTASIAHEINTPLGAINSSAENILTHYYAFANSFVDLLDKLDKDIFPIYYQIIINKTDHELSTREVRKLKKEIVTELEDRKLENVYELAALIVDLEIHEQLDEYEEILSSPYAINILESANHARQLLMNSKNISVAVQKASKIIFALKRYARKDQVEFKEEVDLKDNILTVLTIYQNQLKFMDVRKSFASFDKPLYAYTDELGQVWTNLIHNAIQAMNKDGVLEVSTEQKGEMAVVKIKDNGEGIPDDIKDKVFEPFFTTKQKEEGTGLGLDIVQKIIEKHNGKISFESKKGEGTMFIVELPLNLK